MKAKRTDRNYEYSHKKNVKSLAKALDIKQRIGQASQLHSFTASQLRGHCTQIKQSKTDNFSHIKKGIKTLSRLVMSSIVNHIQINTLNQLRM